MIHVLEGEPLRRIVVPVSVACLTLGAGAAIGAQTPSTRLSITVYPHGRTEPGARSYRLTCGPASGTLPRAARACMFLAKSLHPFAPVPPDTICSQIALGPQEATVAGWLRGFKVSAHLSLSNSCEIARWRRLVLVVPGFPNAIG